MVFPSGGTIGLFTGLSLISIVEASFWLIRTIRLAGSSIFCPVREQGEQSQGSDESQETVSEELETVACDDVGGHSLNDVRIEEVD